MIQKTKNDSTKAHKYGQILGINVNSTTTASLLIRVNNFLSDSSKFYIVTPNSELVLMAQKNNRLKEALNEADLAVPDGVGLNWASRFLFHQSLNIIHGRVLFLELIKEASRKNWKVFLLGGLGAEAELAAQKLKIKDKSLKIMTDSGPKLDQNAEAVSEINRKREKDVIDKINQFGPDLLFVAFGNPKQEIWIHNNLSKLKIGGAMAVGGTFRYIAGLAPLPPKRMEGNFEWLWRLLTEPKRIGRIFRAVIVFPIKVFLSSLL